MGRNRIRCAGSRHASRNCFSGLVTLSLFVLLSADNYACAEDSFTEDVLPLLSDRCFQCHGPDPETREAELRLDRRESLLEDRGGYQAVVPGDAESSEIIARIDTEEQYLRMPPEESGKPALTQEEIELIRRWINGGAKWEEHWSFIPPVKPAVQQVQNAHWPGNPIDNFVLARLECEQLAPSPPAPKEKLIRRASLALTGLPPTPEEVDEFLADDSPDAYQQLVTRLLGSPHYGERMAYVWLDAARYSDTDGYQQDETRNNWPWRDWVVNAYNENLPFDRFTIEQFAGDLLPEASYDQRIATCFHRNHMTNGEGGRHPEESRVDYVLDRTNTMGTVWLGLTLGCCQCHTHKYDPISQHEYYRLTAFFNSIDEDGRAGKDAHPYLDYQPPNSEHYLEKLLVPVREALARAKRRVQATELQAKDRFDGWLATKAEQLADVDPSKEIAWETFTPAKATSKAEGVKLIVQDDASVLASGEQNPRQDDYELRGATQLQQLSAIRLEALPHESHTRGGLARSNSGNFVLTGIEIRLRFPDRNKKSLPLPITSAEADYEQPSHFVRYAIDGDPGRGWGVWHGDIDQPREAVFRLAKPVEVPEGTKVVIRLSHQSRHKHHNLGRFRISLSEDEEAHIDLGPLQSLSRVETPEGLSSEERSELFRYFVQHDGQVGVARAQLAKAEIALEQAKQKTHVRVMVLRERAEPRKSYLLQRGVWDQHGDEVQPGIPEVLGTLPEEAADDRLTLARWLVSRENPLTARVTVNRYWQLHFGSGLVRTPGDFGLQGERPTHPQLLDWLACEFMDSGWDIKHLQRLIVTSSTFRQSSRISPALLERDPENRLLARGPRFRLPAALIRDSALAASGLLARQIGGPSVMPYQPQGVWIDASQARFVYKHGKDTDLYRRSLYGFWRRIAAPPAMFDASDRRTCSVRVVRTNSPMHALNLLNDPTYVEAARSLAQRATLDGGDTPEEQVHWSVRHVLARSPDDNEQEILMNQYQRQLSRFQEEQDAAAKLLSVGESPSLSSESVYDAHLAALTATLCVVLNLDETLNLE